MYVFGVPRLSSDDNCTLCPFHAMYCRVLSRTNARPSVRAVCVCCLSGLCGRRRWECSGGFRNALVCPLSRVVVALCSRDLVLFRRAYLCDSQRSSDV